MNQIDCHLCGARTRQLLYEIPDSVDEGTAWPVWQCAECSLVFLSPPPDGQALSRHYQPEYYGRDSKRFGGPFEAFEVWCRGLRARDISRLRSPGRILDVGCGRGIMLSRLRDAGWEAIGTEVSDMAARHARERLGLEVHTADLRDLPYPPGHFDVITFYHTLEHLLEPRNVLETAHQLLRPGGALVVAVPNIDSLEAALVGPSWFHLDVPRHPVHFSTRTLTSLLEDLGFRLTRLKRFSLQYGPYGMAQSLLNGLGFEPNLLYDSLKTPGARAPRGLRGPRRALQLAANVALLPVIVPLAGLLHLVDGLVGRGSCIEVHADRL